MRRLIIPLAAISAVAVAGCSSMGGGASSSSMSSGSGSGSGGGSASSASSSGSNAATSAAVSAADYVRRATASDMYEIQSSQLMLTSSQDPKIKAFAQMMVRDHTNTTQQLTAAARQAGLSPAPPALDTRQAGLISELQQAAPGAPRDRLYVQQQAAAHQTALDLHQSYASGGDNPQLKAVAAAAVPIIQRHISELQSLPGGR